MIPLTLLFAILGFAGVSVYFIQRKKTNKIKWVWLVSGIIFALMAIIPWTLLILK